MRILVAGMVAADPYQGGATSAVLEYVVGLAQLGHEVWLVDPAEATPEAEAYFAELGLGERAFLGSYGGPQPDLLLNVSGMLRDEAILENTPIRVFLDLDPVFNQLWHLDGVDAGLEGHTHYVTVGRRVPATGHEWIPTLPPVVLERWPMGRPIETDAFTTVANFRAYGSIEHDGVRYGQKAHSLRPLVDLPRRSDERFALALDIHPDEPDLAKLHEHGWELLDPREHAGTPERYAAFVRGSAGELGIAKEGYVVSQCGWFGDRSAAYLASGRPVIAQDTGFGDRLPVGAGLFAFTDTDDVLTAIDAIQFDYGRHARAARAIAEEHFDSRRVLAKLLREVGAVPAARARSVYDATDAELAELVGVRPDALRRRPFEYRSSAPLVEIEAGGRRLLLKDLSPPALTDRARDSKVDFLHDPRREIEVYRSLLAGAELGTAEFVASVVEPEHERYWLVVEKVAGTPLTQAGLEEWPRVARWLARLHDRFACAPTDTQGHIASEFDVLLRYDRRFFERWPARAGVDIRGYDEVVDHLAGLPTTLVHGDLYAPNVLLAGERVCVVDWELVGVGPGVLDVAALTLGLSEEGAATIVKAYLNALLSPPDVEQFRFDLECARLHLAVQWLGWSTAWAPPPEHAHDWRGELRLRAERVGLGDPDSGHVPTISG